MRESLRKNVNGPTARDFEEGLQKKNENPQSNYGNWYTQQIRVD